MAIAAIYVVLFFSTLLTWLGLSREDAWIVIFSGMIFMFAGLSILLNGFQDLTSVYAQALGVIIIFIGAYLTTRSTVEFVRDNM